MWSARHRWLVVAGWFVATIGLFALSGSIGGIRTDDPNGNPNAAQTESAKGYAVFAAGGSGAPSEQVIVVVTHPTLKVTDPRYQAFVGRAVAQLRAVAVGSGASSVPAFASVADPASAPPQAGLVSPDLTSVRIVGTVAGDRATIESHLVPVRPAIAALEANADGFVVHAVSQTLTSKDITDLINSGLDRTFVTIGVTFLILLVTFGALVASLVPLVLAGTALIAAFGLLGIFSQLVTPASPYATQLVVLIGLAVSVDYSLFMITRFRSERRRGVDRLGAIETSSATAGRAVFFSGLAVMISIAGLFMIDVSIFRSMAVGTIGVILVAVIGSLTFLPATLAILGDRVNTGRLPFINRDGAEGSGIWARIVTAVMSHPARSAILSAGFLLVLAFPVLQMRIGLTDFTSFPDQIDGVQAVKLLDAKWPQGTTLSLQVAVTGFDHPATKSAVSRLEQRVSTIPGI
ncbi:MAG TPA: MMPL family transporter, partial [Candidatus Dormibacteraeota bacterium]|nr:MMPL family transporter [Candidatus Dormibacteraeota bacterium]